ncbi:hypothetical protein WA538_000340 [Blastocystis sp. DL]
MSYLSKKSFHPGNKANRERVELSKLAELRLQKKLEEREKEIEKEKQHRLLCELSGGVSKADPVPSVPIDLKKLDEEDHPERKIPDIPENKRVRDYLRSMPLTGHGAAFGKAIRVVQCYRCKCYGHRAGDPECKYTATGDFNQELQRRVREDPVTCFRKMDSGKKESPKVQRMKELLEEAKREQLLEEAKREQLLEEAKREHRHRHRHRHRHAKHHYSSSESASEGEYSS